MLSHAEEGSSTAARVCGREKIGNVSNPMIKNQRCAGLSDRFSEGSASDCFSEGSVNRRARRDRAAAGSWRDGSRWARNARSMTARIAITGMGLVSPLGLDVPTYWQGLLK